jgi:hypothetical protein
LHETAPLFFWDTVESVPALKSCQSTGLRTVGGIAQNEDSAIGASGGWRQHAKYGFGVFRGLTFLLQLRVGVGAQDGHWFFLDWPRRRTPTRYALVLPQFKLDREGLRVAGTTQPSLKEIVTLRP